MSTMTTAELRGYQQICGANGAIMVIACDQRGGIRQILAKTPEERAKITDAMLGDTKSDVVRYLASQAPCVLLDPVCAVPRVVDEAVLPRDVALLIGLDASGYDTDASGHYLSRLAPGIDARKVRELGGTGGKIMVYLRADHPEANGHNMAIIRQCIEDFAREDLLLVVEFLTYALPGEDPAAYKAAFPALIEGGTRLCLEAGAKVLKLPYPGTAQSCAAITAMCGAGSVVGAFRRRRSRDLHGPGRDRHGQWRGRRHRRARAVEGLRLRSTATSSARCWSTRRCRGSGRSRPSSIATRAICSRPQRPPEHGDGDRYRDRRWRHQHPRRAHFAGRGDPGIGGAADGQRARTGRRPNR